MVVLLALLLFYVGLLGDRAVLLLTDGRWPFVLLGVGVVLVPLLGVGLVVAELRLALQVQRLADRLDGEGRLPADEVPRLPSGRVDRRAAAEAFAVPAARVEADPQDWRAWYALGLAYADAGDTPGGRRALRRAVALERAEDR